MDTSSNAHRTTGATAANSGRLRSITMLVIFDIAGPLVAYNLLHSAGLTAVTALLLSGILPAVRVTVGVIRHRRLDVVGALVLAGIVAGTVAGLLSHSARLLLVEGSVPTGVFGVACMGSLLTRHPLMFGFAREFAGPDTGKGREMTILWQHEGYRRVFRVITAVWGTAFLVEAVLRIIIIYNTSTGTALAISKVTPFLFGAILSAWTIAYGAYRKKKGERMMAAAGDVAEAPPPKIAPATDST